MNNKRKTKKIEANALKRACDNAILSTLSYRAVFKSTLSFYQLATFLFFKNIKDLENFELIDRDYLEKRLKSLAKRKKIKYFKGRYHVNKQKPLSWKNRSKNSKKHLKNAALTFEYLSHIKWIKMLAVSGSVAANNAKKTDDIDIFIVTKKQRLWLTRFFTVLILKVLNKYRTDEDYKGKICPNIFVAEESLAWPLKKRNIYTAHEILLLHPVLNRDETYFKFMSANKWVFNYFPNYKIHLLKEARVKPKYTSNLVDIIDFLFMLFQIWYMRKKRTSEITTRSFIHFNKQDHSERILKKFNVSLK